MQIFIVIHYNPRRAGPQAPRVPAGMSECIFFRRVFLPPSGILAPCQKGVTEEMKLCTGFWVGMSAGLMAGVAMGMMAPCGRQSMKTQVGKSIHKLGVAVDHAVDSIVSEMR